MADVSYFMTGALGRDDRRVHECKFLRVYRTRLVELGVRDYAFETMMRDYARYSPALFIMAFAALMIIKRPTRDADMFFAMLKSGAGMVADLVALGLLAGEG